MKISCIFWLLAVCSAGVAAQAATLEIRPYLGTGPSYTPDRVSTGKWPTRIFVTLTNRSTAAITVFTGMKISSAFIPPDGRSEGRGEIVCTVGLEKWAPGIWVVPSSVDLKPVSLNPGESAGFEVIVNLRAGMKVDEIELSYHVPEEIGLRYGGWCGELKSKLLRERITG